MIPAPDGCQYGVRFDFDGSVIAPWNGRTQRDRAEEFANLLRKEFFPDEFTVVRRKPGGEWKSVYD